MSQTFVEPFFGSGAVLLGRPHPPGIETVNDKDGFIVNFWRALQHDPEQVAHYADYPSTENDLHARHIWLRAQVDTFVPRLEGDPDFYDAKIAGWWVWGMAMWIGSGFCGDSGSGPWGVRDGQLIHLGDSGQGVARQQILLGDWFHALARRLRYVRVCCGDWTRVCGPSPTFKQGVTGVFLDPPYSNEERNPQLYREDHNVGAAVREWALANGENPLLRIALCGYQGEHKMPQSWAMLRWKTGGGYANQGENRAKQNAHRETIWFSPHCLPRRQPSLFGE